MTAAVYYTTAAILAYLAVACGFGFLTRSTGDSWWLGVGIVTAAVVVTGLVMVLIWVVVYVGHLWTGVPA